jgi:hypothetical protein
MLTTFLLLFTLTSGNKCLLHAQVTDDIAAIKNAVRYVKIDVLYDGSIMPEAEKAIFPVAFSPVVPTIHLKRPNIPRTAEASCEKPLTNADIN